MRMYNHKKIEQKWQRAWEQQKTFETPNDSLKEKRYVLDMFPYPSSDGLHVGHPEGYTATDIYSRFLRMNGFEVLHPMGWDAFGLPAENFAIKQGVHPQKTTKKNIETFRRQINSLGFSYDWSREINTSSPEYYRWTQWLFLQLYKQGLAYKKKAPVNWCDHCQTVLANEQVINGICERCKYTVIQKELEQWFFKVTHYAKELLENIETLDWPTSIKRAQTNWIGMSEGSVINFEIDTAYTYVLLHGYDGSPEGIFFPWLKKELENRGARVLCPQLPNPGTPAEEEQVQFVLNTCSFDKKTILFGHSLGAVVALKVAEKLKTSLGGLVLAGGFLDSKFRDKPRPFDATFSWKFDFEKIKHTAGFIKILSDINDYAILVEQGRRISTHLSGALLETASAQPHFCSTQEPSILQSLVQNATVFTTRPDTLFGATYLVLAPEHPLIAELKPFITNGDEVAHYQKDVKKKNERERTSLEEEKTGVQLKGVAATNPANGEKIPIWIADYVLLSYGTGAIMAVPAHDERDFVFAKKFSLPIKMVVCPNYPEPTCPILDEAFTGSGHLVESGPFTGMENEKAKVEITRAVGGAPRVQYRLRDWLVSRQRYWGAPIPIIYCPVCGQQPVPEIDLPILLPDDVDFHPTGESPLVKSKSFHKVSCPSCGGPARRESDTMDTFVCSSWYFLRYASPHAADAPFEQAAVRHWLPVDMYVGGAEHAVLHLLYARFITKALHSMGYLDFQEPFSRLRNQGMILGEDGEKMSKSRGNVINPDDIIERYGADTMRLYEMFMGPLEDAKPWSTAGIIGLRRFLEKVWRIYATDNSKMTTKQSALPLRRTLHKTIKKVTGDITGFHFNTAISALMICANALHEAFISGDIIDTETHRAFLALLAPFAPHLAEELAEHIGIAGGLSFYAWPQHNPALIQDDVITLVVQVNGKTRITLSLPAETSEEELKKIALANEGIQKWIAGKAIQRVVTVKNKLVNIVVA